MKFTAEAQRERRQRGVFSVGLLRVFLGVLRFSAVRCVFLIVPFLSAQEFALERMETLAKGYTFTEGPAWSKDGFLIFSDTPGDKL